MSTSPRARAAVTLGRVLRAGAYSNVVLGRLGDSPDERLIRRLVYGTLRRLVAIDDALTRASNRPLADIQAGVLDVLRVGVWELRYGNGAAHAAVNEAVEVAKTIGGSGAGGFVNAVLRGVQAQGPADLSRAARLGVQDWTWGKLAAAWGPAEAEAFLEASLQPAPRTVRLRPGTEGGRPVEGIPGAAEADHVGDGMVVMDPSSVAVGLACGTRPGMAMLDMAAAPGGKAMHAFDLMSRDPGRIEGLLVASDRHPRRVASARSRLQAIGVDLPWLVADGLRLPVADETFDRVLLDAPCTGLGTLRRRPEIRHRLGPGDPARLGDLQRRLLREALRVTRPDGYVVYAVCTVFGEETVHVVADHRAAPPPDLPGRAAGKGWLLAPHLTGSDGMFISVVRP